MGRGSFRVRDMGFALLGVLGETCYPVQQQMGREMENRSGARWMCKRHSKTSADRFLGIYHHHFYLQEALLHPETTQYLVVD